jgi:glucan biosynthesis protein C
MPGFFVIAGFFSALMLKKYSPREFLVRRVRRLCLPLITFVAVDIAIDSANVYTWTDYSQELNRAYWISGHWLEHLWFLGTLLSYVVILFAVHEIWQSMERRVASLKLTPALFLAGIATISFGSAHFERLLPGQPWRSIWLFADQIMFFQYIGFFVAGYLLFHHRTVLNSLSKHVIWSFASVALFWLAEPLMTESPGGRRIIEVWQAVYCLNVCAILFWCGKQFFSKSETIEKLSNASYTIYLVHWPILVLLNRIFGNEGIPTALLFMTYVVITSILSYALHIYVVDRFPLLAFLMNGRPRTQEQAIGQPAEQIVLEST